MTQKAIVVGDARLDYLKGVVSEKKAQTSNSVVRAALDAIKYDHAKAFPDGELKDDFPGIDDNVDKDMDETWDRRLNPGNYGFDNPIDGEIGGTPTGDVPEQPPEPDPAKDDVKGASGADTLVADEGAKPVRRPEVQSFLEDVKTSDDPLADILLKPTGDWTEDEVGQVHRSDAYADPQQPDVAGKVRDWYERHYGTDPVQTDETGRTLEPVFTTVPKKEQVKAKGSDGQSVMEGVLGVGSKIADLADKRGLSTAIRGVQTGLNLLGQLQADDSTKSGPLETDGLFGAKT
ncbi:MAG: hypothetical protein ISR46_06475, partial [Rhodospirillales bacterium]|nr:hypothetical protein [Rhodospirillales bacterium]